MSNPIKPVNSVSTASIAHMLSIKAGSVAANNSGPSEADNSKPKTETFYRYNVSIGKYWQDQVPVAPRPVTQLSEVRASQSRAFFQPLGSERSDYAAKILLNIKEATEEFSNSKNDVTEQKLKNILREAKEGFKEIGKDNFPNQFVQHLKRSVNYAKDLLDSYRPSQSPDSAPRLR